MASSASVPGLLGRPAIRPAWALAAAGAGVWLAIAAMRDLTAIGAGLVLGDLLLLGWIAGHDIETRRAPNVVVLPGIIAVVITASFLGAGPVVSAAFGGLGMFAVFLAIAAIGRGAMGGGDVKAAALCGAITGFQGILQLLFVTFALGGMFAIVAILFRRRGRKDTLPFTPFLAVAVAVVLAGCDVYLVR